MEDCFVHNDPKIKTNKNTNLNVTVDNDDIFFNIPTRQSSRTSRVPTRYRKDVDDGNDNDNDNDNDKQIRTYAYTGDDNDSDSSSCSTTRSSRSSGSCSISYLPCASIRSSSPTSLSSVSIDNDDDNFTITKNKIEQPTLDRIYSFGFQYDNNNPIHAKQNAFEDSNVINGDDFDLSFLLEWESE